MIELGHVDAAWHPHHLRHIAHFRVRERSASAGGPGGCSIGLIRRVVAAEDDEVLVTQLDIRTPARSHEGEVVVAEAQTGLIRQDPRRLMNRYRPVVQSERGHHSVMRTDVCHTHRGRIGLDTGDSRPQDPLEHVDIVYR